jgi:hypothetical protein
MDGAGGSFLSSGRTHICVMMWLFSGAQQLPEWLHKNQPEMKDEIS